MRNFFKLASNVDVIPLLSAIHRFDKSSNIWREDTYLRDYPQGPFGDVESIILRFPTRSNEETRAALAGEIPDFDQHENVDQPIFSKLPEARGIIFPLMAAVQGERLGRCIINKLKPGGVISPHSDSAPHCDYWDRYHVVLQSQPGCNFRCDDEQIYMSVGDVWWFNNALEHEVINNSADDRIHLIVDIRTRK